MERLLERGGRSAGLVLNQQVMTWEPALLRCQGAWMKEHAERVREMSLRLPAGVREAALN
jgi:hypothetical protein